MLGNKDFQQIAERGLTVSDIEKQTENFVRGFPYIHLARPATINDGILFLSEDDIVKYGEFYDRSEDTGKTVKFVPASGAATRMFKDLYAFIDLYNGDKENYMTFMQSSGLNTIFQLITNIRKFAFYGELAEILKKGGDDIGEMSAMLNYAGILEAILEKNSLNYGKLPKGLILFHAYEDHCRTAFEEHLAEGLLYCTTGGDAHLHFTVSPEHLDNFTRLFSEVRGRYEAKACKRLNVEFSFQKPETDMIAVNPDNTPFRNPDGTLLFRPGGHGALIRNLNELDGDLIFIKNIDNVVPEHFAGDTIRYKKALAGVLLKYRNRIHEYLRLIDAGEASGNKADEMMAFLKNELCVVPHEGISDRIAYIHEILNRPLRVCGMVKNEGEPGGGPFWVKSSNGSLSLQIVESSQLDGNDGEQIEILQQSTHFNPVDLICYKTDYNGNAFDLYRFIDHETGFISEKSSGGKKLKAQELPGLWNGAMAGWNTIFVEVPLSTFNPVKTINDLLRKEHSRQ
ncbi:MAG: DUF4301 family protein [Bacteroidota bacterium]